MASHYTRQQIALHWSVAGLVTLAWFTSDDMGKALRARVDQGLSGFETATLHTIAGSLLLAVALWRLAVRLRLGAPDPKGTPIVQAAATLGHWALYGLMIAVPATGAAIWYGGLRSLHDAHETLAPLFMILILGHVAAALWHGVIKRDGTLARMVRSR